MNAPKLSFQDRLKQRQRSSFVGREAQMSWFQQNLGLPLENRRFIFNIWGQGGVGIDIRIAESNVLKCSYELQYVSKYKHPYSNIEVTFAHIFIIN
jgi:hypothetical protein